MKNSAAEEIAAILARLSPAEALQVLYTAAGALLPRLTAGSTTTDMQNLRRRHILRGRIQPFRIDEDLEVKDFLLARVQGLKEPTTIKALRLELVARFGEQRTPSKSALHRYLRKLETE